MAAVLLTHNRLRELEKTLPALVESEGVDEIFVVDNASSDETDAFLRRAADNVRVITSERNLGAAGGRSLGIAAAYEAGHEYFWLVEDDTYPAPEAVSQCRRALEQVPEAGLVGVAGGSYRFGRIRHRRYGPRATEAPPAHYCDFVLTDSALLRRSAVERIGLQREDFFIMLEDIEYCCRLRAGGFAVLAIPSLATEFLHLGAGTELDSSTLPNWRAYYQTRNHYRLALEHRSPLELVGWTMRLVKMLVVALVRPDRRSVISMRLLGAWHGVIGRMGRTIDPAAERSEVP